MLTADHGAHDTTERQHQRAMPMEAHVAPELQTKGIGAAIGRDLGIAGPVLLGAESDIYVDRDAARRRRAPACSPRRSAATRAMPQVAAALTARRDRRHADADHPARDLDPARARPRQPSIPTARATCWSCSSPASRRSRRPAPAMSRRTAAPGTTTAACRSCSGAKGWPGSSSRCRSRRSTSCRRSGAMIGLPCRAGDGRCLDLDPGPATTCVPDRIPDYLIDRDKLRPILGHIPAFQIKT